MYIYIESHLKQTVELPYFSKYLLIAAYLASYNPAKSDKRFFVKVSALYGITERFTIWRVLLYYNIDCFFYFFIYSLISIIKSSKTSDKIFPELHQNKGSCIPDYVACLLGLLNRVVLFLIIMAQFLFNTCAACIM